MEKVKKGWKTFSKKKKIFVIVTPIVSAILIAVIVFLSVWFYQPTYEVDLANIIREDNLAWSDEFNGNALDESVWHIENELDAGGAFHRRSSVSVKDGAMNIDIFYNEEAGEWQCGGIDTMPGYDENGNLVRPGFTQRYGYFEIRAKLADLGGCWSTFWLLSENYDNAPSANANLYGAEIDIVESPLHPKNQIQQALHIGGWGHSYSRSIPNPRYTSQTFDQNLYQSFNTYGLYWNEEIYKFYVNRECVWTTNYHNNVSQVPEGIWLTIGTIAGKNDGLKFWANGNHLYDNEQSARSAYQVDYLRIYNVYDEAGNILR